MGRAIKGRGGQGFLEGNRSKTSDVALPKSKERESPNIERNRGSCVGNKKRA